MGIKRTAKSSDFKRAVTELATKREGTIEGTPNSILISLGFDGSWNEFREGINATVIKTELGRYAVQLSSPPDSSVDLPVLSVVTPKIFAMCASAFVLGEGDVDDFENFTGEYGSIEEIIVPLAHEVDSSISGLYLPFKTESDVEIYTVERSILYTAAGDGLFTVYGATVLEYA